MTNLPEPLTASDCDLRGLPFMPLDVVRLTDSDLFALSTGDEFKAALTLWCKAWLQVPAASLPDDDRILAHLSGTGPRWRKIKEIALRGFVKCDDGRYYHPVIAEKAREAWERRGEWQERQNSKNERQQRWRARVKEVSEQLRDLGITPPTNVPLSTLEGLLVDALASTDASTRVSTVGASETAKTGTGTGTITPLPPKRASTSDEGMSPEFAAIMEAGGFIAPPSDFALVANWKRQGATLDGDILPVMRRVCDETRKRGGRMPFKLKYFEPHVLAKVAEDEVEIERLRSVRRRLEQMDEPQEAERRAVQ